MTDASRLFRKVSLERLSSPEQLDMVMEVTPPRAWLALGAVGVLLIVVTVWGILGSIPEKVTAQGILLRRGGVADVAAPAAGQVAEIAVVEGKDVKAGELLVRIAQPDLVTRLQDAQAVLAENERQDAETAAIWERDFQLRREALRLQRSKLEDSVRFLAEREKSLEEQLRIAEEFQKLGLVSRSSLLQSRDSYSGAQDGLRGARGELQQLDVKSLALQTEQRDAVEKSRMRLEEARRVLAGIRKQLEHSTEVRAPASGRVLEVKVNPGSIVGAGAPLVSLQQGAEGGGEALEALIYVPASSGKNVRVGMEAQVSPTTAKREEFGFLVGKVRHVSEFPATREGMLRVLPNATLVASMSSDGSPFAAYVDLVPDPASASGYRWSSSKGEPIRVGSGTMVTATVVVRERRPISMVIPLLREYTGI